MSEKLDIEKGHSVHTLDEAESVSEIKKPIGVRKIEVVSKQYGFPGKVMVFFFIFLIAYCYGLDGQTRYIYQATATSGYGDHSLLSTINVVNGVVAAAAQPFIARLADIYGRVSILVLSVIFYAIGTLIESQAHNVQTFAGGAVLYQIGYTGLMLILQLVASDMSLLNWRLLALFVPAAPFIINTWISGNITGQMTAHWSWGIGMWAIIVPVSAIPLTLALIHMTRRAHKSAEWEQFREEKLGITKVSPVKYCTTLFWKLDVIGVLLLAAMFALILVPLTLAGGQASTSEQWGKAKIIVPLVIGFCLIPVFLTWEWKCKFPITPWKLLKDRGVFCALFIGVFINFIWYMQGDFMYTVLLVAVNQSVTSATRITSLYSFVSVITGCLLGLVIVKIRRVKPFIIFGSVMWLLAMGLLIKYRGGDESYSGIIGSLCLLGFGAAFFTYPTTVSIQACTKHEHMAVVTALYLASYNIGSGLGGAVSGAIWTQILPKKLLEELKDPKLAEYAYSNPLGSASDAGFIYHYAWGTPERDAVTRAYKKVQRILLVVGTCLCVPLIVCAVFTRDKPLESVQSLSNAELDSQYSGETLKTADVSSDRAQH